MSLIREIIYIGTQTVIQIHALFILFFVCSFSRFFRHWFFRHSSPFLFLLFILFFNVHQFPFRPVMEVFVTLKTTSFMSPWVDLISVQHWTLRHSLSFRFQTIWAKNTITEHASRKPNRSSIYSNPSSNHNCWMVRMVTQRIAFNIQIRLHEKKNNSNHLLFRAQLNGLNVQTNSNQSFSMRTIRTIYRWISSYILNLILWNVNDNYYFFCHQWMNWA